MELVEFLNQTFWEGSGYLILLVLAVFLILREKEEQRGRRIAFYTILCFIFIVYNPILGNLAVAHFMEDERAYLRIFYLLPLMSVIAYAMADYYTKNTAKDDSVRKKLLLVLIMSSLIVISGALFPESMYLRAENIYKIDSEALEVGRIIEEDAKGEKTRALLPNDENLTYGIRQYTGNIVIAGYSDAFKDEATLRELTDTLDFTYLVICKERALVDCLELSEEYQYLVSTEEHFIYKRIE